MKTYVKLEGKLGTHPQPQLCTSTCLPDKSSLLQKTPVPKKAEKKKRAKPPMKRRFKVRVIVQPLPLNPTLPSNPTPMAVTTMATSTQTSAVKSTATTANPTPIPVTLYNLAQSRIQEIPNPLMRRFQGEDPSTPSGDNPSKSQQNQSYSHCCSPTDQRGHSMAKYHASIY